MFDPERRTWQQTPLCAQSRIFNRSCPSYSKIYSQYFSELDLFLTLTIRTDRAYETAVNGRIEPRPFIFRAKVGMLETVEMSIEEVARYIFGVMSPHEPAAQ